MSRGTLVIALAALLACSAGLLGAPDRASGAADFDPLTRMVVFELLVPPDDASGGG